MPVRSLKNRATSPLDTKVSGKEIEFRTAKSARIMSANANFRIWYHMRGSNMGQWWTFWKEHGSNTLQGPLTMVDSVAGSVITLSGQKHTYDYSPYNYVDINLNTYATSTAGKIVVIYKGGTGYRGDVAWSGHLLTCRNGVTVDFDPDLYRQNPSANRPWRTDFTPRTWASVGNNVAAAAANYGSSYGTQWNDVDYGSNNPINYDYGSTPSNGTGPNRNHQGNTSEYFMYAEASTGNGQAADSGYPFFTVHEWVESYNLLTGTQA